MRNILIWIPEFLKGMLEVMKETQERAGGGWKGQLVFWLAVIWMLILFALFSMWFSKYAYGNFTEFLSYFNITVTHVDIEIPSALFTNLLLALLLTIIYFLFLIGIAGVIGTFLGTLMRFMFRQYTTFRIDKIMSELRPLLETANEIDATDKAEQLLNGFNELDTRWGKSRFNRITRRLTPKRTRDKWSKGKE